VPSAAVLDLAFRHPDGLRAGDVARALDLDNTQSRVYLTRLADASRLTRAGRGLYVPLLLPLLALRPTKKPSTT